MIQALENIEVNQLITRVNIYCKSTLLRTSERLVGSGIFKYSNTSEIIIETLDWYSGNNLIKSSRLDHIIFPIHQNRNIYVQRDNTKVKKLVKLGLL